MERNLKSRGFVVGVLFCGVLIGHADSKKFTPRQLQLPGKKGACFTLRPSGHRKGGTVDTNIPKVKALDVSWNYSWGTTLADQQPADVEFIPMIWGAQSAERVKETLNSVVLPQIQAGGVSRLLGFNEPDKEDQANIPYQRALELWPEFEKMGVPLCSPACANPEGINDDSVQGVPGTWMNDFVKEADERGYRLDYIGVHWYGGCNPAGFQNKMKRIYRKYGNRPLLITEFAPADWQARTPAENRYTPAEVLEFMKEVLPWIEKQEWIAGYSWFSFGIDSRVGNCSALFDKNGNLTACGRYYKSVTPDNPRGDRTIKPDRPFH